MARSRELKVDATSPVVGFGERLEPGSLTWVRSLAQPAAEDRLVTAAFQFLVDPAGVTPPKARELGRAMGLQARSDALTDYLEAFSHLGVGRVKFVMLDRERYVFHGHELRGSEAPNSPSCSLALGFLEGAVQATTGHVALGAQMECRSRGHERCLFTIRARA